MERSRRSPRDLTVVFDLGEVLATPEGLFTQLGEVLNRPTESVSAAYWRYRDDHDRGSSSARYWGQILSDLECQQDAALMQRLTEIDSAVWSSVRPDAMELLRDLHGRGVPIAILSNAPVALGEAARRSPWQRYVAHWFFSGDLGIAKPDPDIFAVVATRLSCGPQQLVFFDDRDENVRAAVAAGWDAYHWTSPATPRAALRALGLL